MRACKTMRMKMHMNMHALSNGGGGGGYLDKRVKPPLAHKQRPGCWPYLVLWYLHVGGNINSTKNQADQSLDLLVAVCIGIMGAQVCNLPEPV